MSDREPFLKAIEAHPDDDGPRQVYADWLDERGEVDEADRQRAWRKSYEWLRDEFVVGCWRGYEGEDDGEPTVPVAMRYITRWAEQIRDHNGVCFNDDGVPRKFYHDRHLAFRFMSSLRIVTGIRLDPGKSDEASFRCAC